MRIPGLRQLNLGRSQRRLLLPTTRPTVVEALAHMPVWRGYEDARQSLPWDPNYERWPEDAQLRYEMGRYLALHMAVLGAPLLPWGGLSAPPPQVVEFVGRWVDCGADPILPRSSER
jgi:hypothetical protein